MSQGTDTDTETDWTKASVLNGKQQTLCWGNHSNMQQYITTGYYSCLKWGMWKFRVKTENSLKKPTPVSLAMLTDLAKIAGSTVSSCYSLSRYYRLQHKQGCFPNLPVYQLPNPKLETQAEVLQISQIPNKMQGMHSSHSWTVSRQYLLSMNFMFAETVPNHSLDDKHWTLDASLPTCATPGKSP